MRKDEFVRRRLRQLIREELERMDLKALVHEVLRDEFYDPVVKRRPELKVVQ